MNARKATAALVFLVALSLSFGYLRVQATGSCSRTAYRIPVTANTESHSVSCFAFRDFTWTIGSDLCNTSPYEGCARLSSCNVPKSDFLQRDRTFVCCNNGTTCYEFTIDPVVNDVNLPPVMEAEKEATVYTTFAAKPKPSPSDIPSLNVSGIQGNETCRIDIVRVRTIPSPTNITEYIILHTFMVPKEYEGVAFSYSLPLDWSSDSSVDLTLGPIGIVRLDDEPTSPATDAGDTRTTTDPATDPGATTTDISPTSTAANTAATSTSTALDKTASMVGPTATNIMTVGDGTGSTTGLTNDGPSACIAVDHLVVAIVISIAVPVTVFTAIVCVFCFWNEKWRYPKKRYSNEKDIKPSEEKPPHHHSRNNTLRTSLSLQVNPATPLITQHSLTPGETPADERTGLLRSNHAAASASSPGQGPVTGAVNPGYHSSPTTPYSPATGEPIHPLLGRIEPSAAAAASSFVRIEPLEVSNGKLGEGVSAQHEVNANTQQDSTNHIYDELNTIRPRGPLPDIPTSNKSYPPPRDLFKPIKFNNEETLRDHILNQNNLINSVLHPNNQGASVEDDGIPVYDRSNDGEGMYLPSQPSIEVTSV